MPLSWVIVVLIQVLAACFALTPVTVGVLLPVRILVGAAASLMLPGALATAARGSRPRHVLEGLAISAFGSFAIIAVLGLAAMALHASMGLLVAVLFALNAALTLVCLRRRPVPAVIVPRRMERGDVALVLLIGGLGVVAYRWGDDVKAVGWELALHLDYVRQYASRLPLGFQTAALRPPEAIAQNYLYLWEFTLAVIARMSGVDALVAALKCRWLMPVLGFASFFFMVQRLMGSSRVALKATWVMVAAVGLQFLTLAPNPYEMYIESGPLRQVGAFLGSIHHSDAAMEILLPAIIGYLFWALRRGTAQAWAGVAGALVIAFLWHPREYFQVMWYGAVAILVDVIAVAPGGWRSWRWRLTNYAVMVLCYLGVAGVLYAAMPASIRSSSEHVVGTATQWQAIRQFAATAGDWRGWTVGSLPLGFHLHGYEAPGVAASAPMSFSWLVLAVPAAAFLAFSPSRRSRWLALYLLVLWLTSLSSLRFEQLLQAITYGEMMISKPRIVYLFAYAVIGVAWSEFAAWAGARGDGRLSYGRASVAALACGVVSAAAWKTGAPEFKTLFNVLNVLFAVAAVLLVISLWSRSARRARWRPSLSTPIAAGVTFAVFAAPLCASQAATRWTVMLANHLDPASLFSAANPLELAPDTIDYFQTVHPPRRRLLVEPNRPHIVGIYAPVYVMPLMGNVGADMPQLELARTGRHPIFSDAMRAGTASLPEARAFLRSNNIAHILGAGAYVPAFLALAGRDPEFVVRFLSRDKSNVVLEFEPPSARP